jgi:hypothetical protein
MSPKIRKLLLSLGAIFVLVLTATVALMVSTAPQPVSFLPLPNPNGYDDLLSGAKLATGDAWQVMTNADPAALRDFLAKNTEPLRLIHLGLTRQCSTPTEVWVTNFDVVFNDLPSLKRAALLLETEGKNAELENRLSDAAQAYLNTIHFGDDISRGGFLVNRLVGIACESIGCDALVKLAPKLNCDQMRPIIVDLEQIDRTGVTWGETLQGENTFAQYQLRRLNPFQRIVMLSMNQAGKKKAEVKNQVITARLRLLTTELALRCYQSEQGKAAESLEQLVPKYLKAVPQDPFKPGPLFYHLEGTEWQLHSVGLLGKDGTHGAVKLTFSDR